MVSCGFCGYGKLSIYEDGKTWKCDYCGRIYEVTTKLVQYGSCDYGRIGQKVEGS